MRRLAAAILTTGLLLGAGLTACGDQGSATSAGEVVVGHPSDDVTGDSAFVLLPTGRIDLTVGEPTDELTEEQVGDAPSSAPDGGSFLPVSWAHDPFGESGVPIGVIGAEPQEAQVTLVAGETRADLGSPYRVVGDTGTADTGVSTMYVAVDQAPDDVGDVSFEVTYDGLTQTVSPATGERDAGAAAPLYDEPTIGVEAPCTSEGFATPQVQPDVSCVVNAPQRTPYLPGHGWAEEGRTFVLVSAFFTVDSVEVGGTVVRRRGDHAPTDAGRRGPAAPGRQVRRPGAGARSRLGHLGLRRARRRRSGRPHDRPRLPARRRRRR